MDLFDTNTTFERQLFAKAARNRIPLYGVLELLPLCNLNCDMCYVHLSKQEMQSQGGLRSVDEWISFAHQMKDAGTLFLLLTGGEPLLFPQFKELYTTLKDMGMILTINSSITSENSNTYIENATANQMAKSFPYILKSGAFKEVLAQDLGLQSVPGTIEAEVMENTNLFTLKVTANNPKMAEKILKAVVKNYPSVAEFVIGSSQLTLMDESGVPTTPANPFSYRHEIQIGVLIGILLCILLDVLLALGKNTVKKEEDFKRLFHAKSLGIMPHAKFHKKRTQTQELIVLDNPRIPRSFLEAARTVRRRIERAQKETGMKSFLVTSAMPGEGKSTVSANIAISLAMKGYKVILVDADLRNPSTAKVLGMNEQELGTLEVMKGEVNIDDAVQQYKNTSVKVLAGSTPIQDTSTVLSGKNMRQFVKELEAEADFVIIDTPPSGLLSDAAIVAQYVDGAVFVIRQDYTDVDRILEGMEILSGSGAEITGCILNDVNVRTSESQHYMNSYRTKGETL